MQLRPFSILAVAAACLGGCYQYTAMPPEQIPLGANVRVNLTATGADRLAEALGGDDRSVDAQLLGRTPASLTVAVPERPTPGAVNREAVYQHVELTPADFRQLELRQLDAARTTLLVVGIAAVVATVVKSQFWTERSGITTPGGGPAETRRPLPILSIPIGRGWP